MATKPDNTASQIGKDTQRQAVLWKRRIVRRTALGVLVLILAAVPVWYVSSQRELRSQVDIEIQKLRDEGYPVTMEELSALTEIPQLAENAADTYGRAFDLYVKPDANEASVMDWYMSFRVFYQPQALAPEVENAARSYLAKNQESLELTRQAAAMKYCRFVGMDGQIDQEQTHVRGLVKVVRLILLEQLLNARSGDAEAAVESLELFVSVANSVRGDLLKESQMFCCITLGTAAKLFERTINDCRLSQEQLLRMQGLLHRADRTDSIERMTVGERCKGLAAFDLPIGKLKDYVGIAYTGPFSKLNAIEAFSYRASGADKRDKLAYIDLMEQYIADSRLPTQARIEAFAKTDQLFNELSRQYQITRYIVDRVRDQCECEIHSIGQIRGGIIAAAVLRYGLKYGQQPESLQQLVPEFISTVPKDPATGETMKYILRHSGFVAYSVGANRVDNGGNLAWRIGETGGDWDYGVMQER